MSKQEQRSSEPAKGPLTPPKSAKSDAAVRVARALKARADAQKRRVGKATSFRPAIGSHGQG